MREIPQRLEQARSGWIGLGRLFIPRERESDALEVELPEPSPLLRPAPQRRPRSAVRDAGPLQRLAQRARALHLEAGSVQVREARGRHDRALEAKTLCLLETDREPLHSTQPAAKSELADEDCPRIRRPVA